MAGVATEFHEPPGWRRQPASKEIRFLGEWRIGDAQERVVARQAGCVVPSGSAAALPAQDDPFDPCSRYFAKSPQRFDHTAHEWAWEFGQHARQDVSHLAKDVNVVVAIHVGGRSPHQIDESLILGAEFGMQFHFSHSAEREPFEQRSQAWESAIRPNKRRNFPRWQHRGVNGQARVPAEFNRLPRRTPDRYPFFREWRIDQEYSGSDDPASSQFENSACRFRPDAEVVGRDD